MRVFDFDNTIYDGESVIDFYLFSLRRNPKVARYVPVVLYHLLRYKLGAHHHGRLGAGRTQARRPIPQQL